MAQLAGVKAPESLTHEVQAHEIEGFVMDDVIEELKEDLSSAEIDTVEYTDPAGNTFELPSIEPEVAPQRVKFAVDLEQEDEVVSTEPAAEDHETFEEECVASIDTINLNENTTIAVVVDETEKEDDDDFGFSFDLNEDNNDNELFL
jgi:hypothetical protein